jgi:hypothetical protein
MTAKAATTEGETSARGIDAPEVREAGATGAR